MLQFVCFVADDIIGMVIMHTLPMLVYRNIFASSVLDQTVVTVCNILIFQCVKPSVVLVQHSILVLIFN